MARLRIDAPRTATFYHPETGLRIDLLFDFPLPGGTLVKRATRVRLGEASVHVAHEADLLELKRIAAAERDAPGDAEDIRFLERRLSGR